MEKLDNEYYCSECKKQTNHFVQCTDWEESKKFNLYILKCCECEYPSISWIQLKEK